MRVLTGPVITVMVYTCLNMIGFHMSGDPLNPVTSSE